MVTIDQLVRSSLGVTKAEIDTEISDDEPISLG
jgi:hypothetical protein